MNTIPQPNDRSPDPRLHDIAETIYQPFLRSTGASDHSSIRDRNIERISTYMSQSPFATAFEEVLPTVRRNANAQLALLCAIHVFRKHGRNLTELLVNQILQKCLSASPSEIPSSSSGLSGEAFALYARAREILMHLNSKYKRDFSKEPDPYAFDHLSLIGFLDGVKISRPVETKYHGVIANAFASYGKIGEDLGRVTVEREVAVLRRFGLLNVLNEFSNNVEENTAARTVLLIAGISSNASINLPLFSPDIARKLIIYCLRGVKDPGLDPTVSARFDEIRKIHEHLQNLYRTSLPAGWPRRGAVARTSFFPRIELITERLSNHRPNQSYSSDQRVNAALDGVISDAKDDFYFHPDRVQENLRGEIHVITTHNPELMNVFPALSSRYSDGVIRKFLLSAVAVYENANKRLDLKTAILLEPFVCGDGTANLPPDESAMARNVRYVFQRFNDLDRTLPFDWPSKIENGNAVMRTAPLPKAAIARLFAEERELSTNIPSTVPHLRSVLDVVRQHPDIHAVSFDFMDTLAEWTVNVDERRADMYNAASDIFKKYGISVSPAEYAEIRSGGKSPDGRRIPGIWNAMRAEYNARHQDFKAEDAFRAIVDAVCKSKNKTLTQVQREQLVKDLENATYENEWKNLVPSPYAKDLIRSLHGMGKKIVIYSNAHFSKRYVLDTFEKLGLLQYIGPENVFVSCDTGWIKTEKVPHAFNIVQRHLGIPAHQILHVGDNAEADYRGAKNAGFRAVQYVHPHAFRVLNKLKSGTEAYAQRAYEVYADRQRELSSYYMERSVPAEDLTPEVARVAMRAYEIARDVYGSALLPMCIKTLDEMQKSKKPLCLCVGRDGFAELILMKRLLHLQPQRWPNINKSTSIRHLNVSRDLMKKVLGDAGLPYKGRPVARSAEHNGYKARFDSYIRSLGFADADSVTVIDSGIEGSTQLALQNLYPSKNIRGRYLYFLRRPDFPIGDKAEGYFLESELRKPGSLSPSNPAFDLSGDPIYRDPSAVYFIEDMFNGVFASNTVLDPILGPAWKGRPSHLPRYARMLAEDASWIDPDPVDPELRKNSVYQLIKKMALRGLLDAASLEDRRDRLNPNGTFYVGPTPDESRSRFTSFIRSYVDHVQNPSSARKSSSALPDVDIKLTDFVVRRIGYQGKKAEFVNKWRSYLQKTKKNVQ